MRYDTSKIGERIQNGRKKRNLSREQLAEILDLSDSYLGLVERGSHGITIENLIKVAEAFDISIEEFLISDKASATNKFYTLVPIIENFNEDQIELTLKMIKDLSIYFKKLHQKSNL